MRVACNAINAAVIESAAASLISRIGNGIVTEIETMIGTENAETDPVAAAAALAKRNWAQKSAS